MYDIHNHVLPQVDDGAKGLRESLRMLESAILQGITHVLCTPHANDRSGQQAGELFEYRFQELLDEVKRLDLPVELGLGSEIMFGMNIADLLKYRYASLNGTEKYFLVEFPRQTPFEIILNVVKAAKKWNRVPVVAHHERYPLAFRNADQLIKLRAAGAILTMDAGSLTGQFGKAMQKHARDLLATGHIEILTSDAHDAEKQSFCLAASRDEAAVIVGSAAAWQMVLDAPRRIWFGDDWPKYESNAA
ncbi:MAG: hypothetical protein IPG71_06615 [bacterium]|nr:hypothetical protein [bacterium]